MGWDEIERVDGFAGLKAYAEAEVVPVLESDTLAPGNSKKLRGRLSRAFSGGFFAFVITFMIVQGIMPDTWWGETLVFILFPLLFFGSIICVVFLVRASLIKLILETKSRFLVRSRALSLLAARLGLTYVPTPGGKPAAITWLADQTWAPQELKDAAAVFDQTAGMEAAVEAAREAGVMIEANVYVIGSAEQKEKYQKMAAGQSRVEDGFHGRRSGVDFELFEWIEKVDENPDIHHLVVVLEAPLTLHGITQMKSRKASWPQDASGVKLQEVDLGPKAFDQLYKLRASDQVEARTIFNPAVIERVIALAGEGQYRAVGKGNQLVFDFPGTNRFALMDLVTGDWSAETVQQTAADLAAALSLADTLAHAFMLARKSDTGSE